MKIRSTARATAPARRPRQRRATQSAVLGLMVAGLVLGAFAAPSVAVDDEPGGSVVAADDGVMPQTIEAIDQLKDSASAFCG